MRRTNRRGFTAAAVSVVAAMTLAACGGSPQGDGAQDSPIPDEYQRLVLVGASQGGILYSWAVAVSQIFNQELGMQTSVQASATQANALDLESGQIEFGFLSVGDLLAVSPGSDAIQNTEIRTLWASISSPFHIIVGDDTNIQSVEDIAGHGVVTGVTGSIESEIAKDVFRCAGVDESSLQIQNIGKDEGVAAFGDGTVDAWTGLGGKPTASFLAAFESRRGARLIGLDNDVRSCVRERFIDLVDSTIPADTYPDQKEDVPTLDQWFYAAVPASMPDDVVETLARTLGEHYDELVEALPAAADSTAENTAEFPGFQLHPGTVAALNDLGVEAQE